MAKKTKLTEKAIRISDIRHTQWNESFEKYFRDIENLNKEQARAHRFSMLLQELLGIEPYFIENYSSGIEQYIKIKQKDRIIKGEVDNLFGNIIIEFERDIQKKLPEAEEQLRRYTSILWSQEPPASRTPYLCIATDCKTFITYTPIINRTDITEVRPDDICLQKLEVSDWPRLQSHEIYFWLDRYFLRKEILHPTSETIVRDFGLKSHAFQIVTGALVSLWKSIKGESEFYIIYESWEKYLRIVYGSDVAGDELFIRHTYLATLAKLMSWMRIGDSTSVPGKPDIITMLDGRLFKSLGIENFIEEDFFSWLARKEVEKLSVTVIRLLFSLLQNYNLRELSEDVLKSLYQELVDPETRHDLGEFYTPDWLAHRMVQTLLKNNPRGSVLDPACGSGTFLYCAIREKRELLGDTPETLRHIFDSVYGADIHPLAVTISKTNYLLALGDLLKKRPLSITIPVYLADTIKLPELVKQEKMTVVNGELTHIVAGYRVDLDGIEIRLPRRIVSDASLYGKAIELAKDFALQNRGTTISSESFKNYLYNQQFSEINDTPLVLSIFAVADALKQFIDTDRDSIWAYILKNIYKPLFLKRKFDFVVGNPPWISFRYMEPKYQTFLKKQIVDDYKLLTGRGELITHLEIATLFMVRGADLYLKEGGTIAFVLPWSIFSADQHDGFRRGLFKFSEDIDTTITCQTIWDCESVAPLFKVPSCVVFALKEKIDKMQGQKRLDYSVKGEVLNGKLDRKNAPLHEAESMLTSEMAELSLHIHGKRSFWAQGTGYKTQEASYYKDKFFEGATIVPRSFWFVQVITLGFVGFNPQKPYLETSDYARKEAKDAYKTVYIKGNVERDFLYATLLSSDLVPFCHLDYRLIVLPILPEGDHYRMLDIGKAHWEGYYSLRQWLEKAEEELKKRRGIKAEKMSVFERLEYRGKLKKQNAKFKYYVLYNASGTFLTAAVIKNTDINFNIEGQVIMTNGFIVESKTYYFETNNEYEALYLLSILNSPEINLKVKPMQSRGLWGPRDFHKKVLEFPIPQYDESQSSHNELVNIGNKCTIKVKEWLDSGEYGKIKNIGKLRSMVRTLLQKELKKIDNIVQDILKE